MSYSLELLSAKPKAGDTPFSPISHIYVKTHSLDEAGHIFITPECMSLREMEEQIDRLKEELESIRRKAKGLYKK